MKPSSRADTGGASVIIMKAIVHCLILAVIPFFASLAQDSTLVVGSVVSTDGAHLPYSTYAVSPGSVHRFTNSEGVFSLRVPSHHSYRIAVKQLGYAPLDTIIAVGAGSAPVRLRLALRSVVYRLAAVRTVGRRTCAADIRATELAGILEEVEKNAERELLLRQSYPFEYRLERTHRSEWSGNVSRYSRDTLAFLSTAFDPYRPVGVVRETNSDSAIGREMRIPQLTDFVNEAFLANHCFSYGGVQMIEGAPAYQIDFEPGRHVRAPDVEGSVMLDTATLVIRRAVFSLTRGDELKPPVAALEVSATYRDLFKGVAIFDRIRSVQHFPHERPTDAIQTQTEEQRLLGVKFLGRSPGQMNDSGFAASRIEVPLRNASPVTPPLSPSEFTDSAHRVVDALMDADLRHVGFFDRRSRFPRAMFLGLDEIERRVLADSARLLPEIKWVDVGAAKSTGSKRGGITVRSRDCAVNLYVNGKLAATPDAQSAGVRNVRIMFGPELSPSKLGAIELYPAGAGVPKEFPPASPGCGTILIWTRPEPPA